MKNKVIILTIIALILIIGDFLLYQDRDLLFKRLDDNKKVEKKKKEDSPSTVFGIVYEVNAPSLVLKANDGYFYTLNIPEGIDISSLKLGTNVKITYKKSLDINKDIQDIEIKNVDLESTEELPEAWQDTGIFKDYYQEAYEKLKTLTLEEKIGQLLLVRVPEDGQIEAIQNYNLGGYILFGRDTKGETKDSLKSKIASYQQAAKIPLLIATDEEGGTVVRISNNPNLRESKFLSPRDMYNEAGYEGISEEAKEMNNLLTELGINVNLAPVADISTDESDFIYQRSFGVSTEGTSKFIETVIKASKESKVSNVLKHFPGYGNNKDTHTGISIDERSLDSFKENDLVPFKTGITAGAEAIMVSHNIINAVDGSTSASLSFPIHKLATNYLGFRGILMTDDLDMDAIKENISNFVVKALLANNDLLILSDYEEALNEIKNALNGQTLTEEYLDYHVFRVLAWKYYKGLLS